MRAGVSKKFFVCIIAMVLILGTIITMNVYAEEPTYTITINNNDNVEHHYEAYQIFAGDLYEEEKNVDGENKTEKTLSNIKWGKGFNSEKAEQFYNELKTETTFGEDFTSKDCKTPRQVAEVIDQWNDDEAKLKKFAEIINEYLVKENAVELDKAVDGNYKATVKEPGYYFIKDADESLPDNAYAAYTRYMLKVVSDIDVEPKSEIPTVKKSLSPTDTNVKVADHAINEKFNYYLTANLPEDEEFSEYETYKIVFEDTMDAGITYDGITSIEIKSHNSAGEEVETFNLEKEQYTSEGTVGQPGQTLKITITDLKSILTSHDADIAKGVDVIVTYQAHLNENAKASSNTEKTENGTNNNTVKLQYSNNPNADHETSMGTTVGDTNYVFTYEVFNTKYSDDAKKGNELPKAGFELYNGEAKINLIYDSEIEAYRPTATGEEAEIMMSNDEGVFNIKGLDAGTYILREVVTPPGYNTCDDIEIIIGATTGTSTPELTFIDTTDMDIDIVNVHGSKLPSTGSITLIIICGVALVLGVGGLILSKDKKEE